MAVANQHGAAVLGATSPGNGTTRGKGEGGEGDVRKPLCGLADCDCGHTIERLEALAKRFAGNLHYKDVHELTFKDCPYRICQEARDAIKEAMA
jgi:hypothetical protein